MASERRSIKPTPPLERGMLIADRLLTGRPVTTADIRRLFNVSSATAKRDLLVAETVLRCDAYTCVVTRAVKLTKSAAKGRAR